MNIFIWILQILLAFWNITGGLYMTNNYQMLATNWASQTFPHFFWITLGVVQVICALGLIIPGIMKKSHKITAISAICLCIISLAGTVLYVSFSGFPGMLWGILPAALAGFVAYQRMPHDK